MNERWGGRTLKHTQSRVLFEMKEADIQSLQRMPVPITKNKTMMQKRRGMGWLFLAVISFIAGGLSVFLIKTSMNPYTASLAFSQVWFGSILCVVVGVIVGLKTALRPWGVTLILIGISILIGSATVSVLVPAQDMRVSPIVTGTTVRIQLREGTTEQQKQAFLCEHIYETCLPTGSMFRAEILSITSTETNELTIGTTSEFQLKFFEQVRHSAAVESVHADPR